jgi:hypothetical protein
VVADGLAHKNKTNLLTVEHVKYNICRRQARESGHATDVEHMLYRVCSNPRERDVVWKMAQACLAPRNELRLAAGFPNVLFFVGVKLHRKIVLEFFHLFNLRRVVAVRG